MIRYSGRLHVRLFRVNLGSLQAATKAFYLSVLFHKMVVESSSDDQRDGINIGNKAATLIGDLFITKAYHFLAKTKSCKAFELMSEAFCTIQENEMSADNNDSADSVFTFLVEKSFQSAVSFATGWKNSEKASATLSQFGAISGKLFLLN